MAPTSRILFASSLNGWLRRAPLYITRITAGQYRICVDLLVILTPTIHISQMYFTIPEMLTISFKKKAMWYLSFPGNGTTGHHLQDRNLWFPYSIFHFNANETWQTFFSCLHNYTKLRCCVAVIPNSLSQEFQSFCSTVLLNRWTSSSNCIQ